MSDSGLLIVNADDFGGDRPATDAILTCFQAGRISSTSGMVYMADSARAAATARRLMLPVGLHLNLTLPYDEPDVPTDIRARQARLVRAFRRLRVRNHVLHRKRRLYYPWLRDEVALCVREQMERFRSIYGTEPSHVDGHHQIHLTPTVLRSDALAAGSRIRLTNRHGARGTRIAARFRAPQHFFCLQDAEPFGPASLSALLAPAIRESLEVEVHPALGELDFLMSDAWARELAHHRLGSFRDLPRSGCAGSR